jgi:hypothetical protein
VVVVVVVVAPFAPVVTVLLKLDQDLINRNKNKNNSLTQTLTDMADSGPQDARERSMRIYGKETFSMPLPFFR